MSKAPTPTKDSRELKEAARLLKQCFEHAPFRVYAKDTRHRFFYANRETHKAHNSKRVIGSSDEEFFSQEFAKLAKGEERKLLTKRIPLCQDKVFEPWHDGRL